MVYSNYSSFYTPYPQTSFVPQTYSQPQSYTQPSAYTAPTGYGGGSNYGFSMPGSNMSSAFYGSLYMIQQMMQALFSFFMPQQQSPGMPGADPYGSGGGSPYGDPYGGGGSESPNLPDSPESPGGDTTSGSGGDDTIGGGYGDDTTSGSGGEDTIGGSGGDTTSGSGGDDTIDGSGGEDTVGGGAGGDSGPPSSNSGGKSKVVNDSSWNKNVNVFTTASPDETSQGTSAEGYWQTLSKELKDGKSLSEAHDGVNLSWQTQMRTGAANEFQGGKGGKILIAGGDNISRDELEQHASVFKEKYGLEPVIIDNCTPDQLKQKLEEMSKDGSGGQLLVDVLAHGAHDDSGEGNGNMAMGKGGGDQWLDEKELKDMINKASGSFDSVNLMLESCYSGQYVT